MPFYLMQIFPGPIGKNKPGPGITKEEKPGPVMKKPGIPGPGPEVNNPSYQYDHYSIILLYDYVRLI